MSVEELWTGVEVRRAPCVCPACLRPLFGVLGKVFAVDWPSMATSLPDTAFDCSVARDETVSEVTFSVAVFLGSLFVVFRDPPFIVL